MGWFLLLVGEGKSYIQQLHVCVSYPTGPVGDHGTIQRSCQRGWPGASVDEEEREAT